MPPIRPFFAPFLTFCLLSLFKVVAAAGSHPMEPLSVASSSFFKVVAHGNYYITLGKVPNQPKISLIRISEDGTALTSAPLPATLVAPLWWDYNYDTLFLPVVAESQFRAKSWSDFLLLKVKTEADSISLISPKNISAAIRRNDQLDSSIILYQGVPFGTKPLLYNAGALRDANTLGVYFQNWNSLEGWNISDKGNDTKFFESPIKVTNAFDLIFLDQDPFLLLGNGQIVKADEKLTPVADLSKLPNWRTDSGSPCFYVIDHKLNSISFLWEEGEAEFSGGVLKAKAPDAHRKLYKSLSSCVPALPNAAFPVPTGLSSEDFDWLSRRNAWITVQQTQTDKLTYPGAIQWQGLKGDLGETPPRIVHQLRANQCAILLGQLDNRHFFERQICIVYPLGGTLHTKYEVSVTFPRHAGAGGIVLHWNEFIISHVGVIIPAIQVPAGDDPASPQWSVSVRIDSQHRTLGTGELANLVPQRLDSEVLLLPTHPDVVPKVARVLWLELDDEWAFQICRQNHDPDKPFDPLVRWRRLLYK